MAIEKARRCMSIEDFKMGDKFEKDYSINYEMVKKFSEISGDWNPAHHDAEYAAGTIFKISDLVNRATCYISSKPHRQRISFLNGISPKDKKEAKSREFHGSGCKLKVLLL